MPTPPAEAEVLNYIDTLSNWGLPPAKTGGVVRSLDR